MSRARALAGVHAAYLLGTGIWPLLHRKTFEAVAGAKEDFWLARTVGGLAAGTGASLGLTVLRNERAPASVVLAVASGVVFATADVRAVRTESPAYLADTLVQALLVPAWLLPWRD